MNVRSSTIAGAGCILCYAITALAYLGPVQTSFQSKDASNGPRYSQIFEAFIQTQEAEDKKSETLLVITDPSWCTPCRRLEPVLQSLKQQGYEILTKLPREHNHKVSGIPTLIFYTGEHVDHMATGYKSEKYIKEHLTK